MAQAAWPLREIDRGFGRTARRDAWWVQPLLTSSGFSAFVVYSTWAAFQGESLQVRAVPVAVLLPGAVRRRRPTRGSARSRRGGRRCCRFPPALLILLGAGRLPLHLLLLPRRVLQGVLGRSRRPAPSASRASAIAASAHFR